MIQPRIYRVMYRSGHNGKLVKVFAKVPYSGVYAMTETLTRAMTTGEIIYVSIAPAKASEITPKVRDNLERWPVALRQSSEKTGVSWMS